MQEDNDDDDMTPHHYTCGVCSQIFPEKQALWDHMPFHYSTDKEGEGSDENDDQEGEDGENGGNSVESNNNNVVSTGAHGKQPVESDHIFCQQCSKSFGTDKQFVGHINKIHSDMNIQCISPKCGYLFSTRRAFVYHIKTHKDLRLYHCEYCNDFFVSQTLVEEHQKIHKDSDYKFQCQYCSKNKIPN